MEDVCDGCWQHLIANWLVQLEIALYQGLGAEGTVI